MKKLFIAILCIVLAVSISACGTKPANETPEQSKGENAPAEQVSTTM